MEDEMMQEETVVLMEEMVMVPAMIPLSMNLILPPPTMLVLGMLGKGTSMLTGTSMLDLVLR
jgi:hypothetical protein